MKKVILAVTAAISVIGLSGIAQASSNTIHKKTIHKKGDPLLQHQWHYKNTGQASGASSSGEIGFDTHIAPLHSKKINALGQGVTVGIIDQGVEMNHPDLRGNTRKAGSINFNAGPGDPGRNDPTPPQTSEFRSSAHGSAVAGIIAAKGWNGIGGRGIAPKAKINSFNYLDHSPQTTGNFLIGMGNENSPTRVINQSIGDSEILPVSFTGADYISHEMVEARMRSRSIYGPEGKGAIFVKSAGNAFNGLRYQYSDDGDANTPLFRFFQRQSGNQSIPYPFGNANFDADNTNYWNLVVSAMNASGKRSSYSSVGSNVYLTAPGGEYGNNNPAIVTTDLTGCRFGFNQNEPNDSNRLNRRNHLDRSCDYTARMNGTSSAAPNTSGVIAALMSAFPKRSSRDIRWALMKTARHIDRNYSVQPWIIFDKNGADKGQIEAPLEPWEKNAAGVLYSPYYGFGLINAKGAYNWLKKHPRVPALDVAALDTWYSSTDQKGQIIPDADPQGVESIINYNDHDLIVEAVQVQLDITASRYPDLSIELISPSGTRSVLVNVGNGLVGTGYFKDSDMRAMLPLPVKDWQLLSHKFSGENAQGDWRLRVIDADGKLVRTYLVQQTIGSTNEQLTYQVENGPEGRLNSWKMRIIGYKGNKA